MTRHKDRVEFGESGVAFLDEEGNLLSAWVDDGQTTLIATTLEQAKEREKHYQKTGQIPCTMCGQVPVVPGTNPRHFAGVYCTGHGSCWERYKRRRSQRCKKCGDPYWKCVC